MRNARWLVAIVALALLPLTAHAESDDTAVGAGGGGPGTCTMSGRITYNGQPVKNESVTCHDAVPPAVTDTTDSNGNYVCAGLNPGTITLEARGTMAPSCPDSCPDNSSATCNPNVTGCGQPSVTFVGLFLPPSLLAPAWWRRRRAAMREALGR